MGFKGLVGIVGCVIGLAVVYFGHGIRTETPEKKIAVEPSRAASDDRKRPVRAMNLALGIPEMTGLRAGPVYPN